MNLRKEDLRQEGDQRETSIHVKPMTISPLGPTGENVRSNKDISKRRQGSEVRWPHPCRSYAHPFEEEEVRFQQLAPIQ